MTLGLGIAIALLMTGGSITTSTPQASVVATPSNKAESTHSVSVTPIQKSPSTSTTNSPASAPEKSSSPYDIFSFDNFVKDIEQRKKEPQKPVDLSKSEEELSELVYQPPADPSDYAVALAKIMNAPVAEAFAFAKYKDIEAKENLGTGIQLGSSEARMATVETSDGVMDVIAFYLDRIYSQGRLPRVQKIYDNTVYITYVDEDGFMRVLTLVSFSDQTVVFAAIADARKVYRGVMGLDGAKNQHDFDDVRDPVSAEQNGVNITTKNNDSSSLVRKVEIKAPSSAQVLDEYYRQLTLDGWNLIETNILGNDRLFAMFEKDIRMCSIQIEPSVTKPGIIESSIVCHISNGSHTP